MKYSYKWLKELSGTKKDVEGIADLLTFHAFEIEGIEKKKEDRFGKIVVGEILQISVHPNADKLQLVRVNIGTEFLDIVCGAHNIKIGDKVPVALVGAKLSNGLEIKEAEIRGVKSFGMLCAQDEIDLGTDHSGIFILGAELKNGISLLEALELDDASIEIDVLANRAHDALSHVGMAREIATIEKRQIDYDYDGLVLPKSKSDSLKIMIEDKAICSRYVGVIMDNVEIKESPQWMKNRLAVSGIRSINNVVDATNYVMLELGQPMHAFDFDKIKSADNKAEIKIRSAREGEEIVILDGTIKKLTIDDIVIGNPTGAIALAGIMGGADSGVTEHTKKIVLEAANFDAATIRKTRMRLDLPTDAAIRFEKQLDASLAEKAMVRVVEIIEHIAQGKVLEVCDEYLIKTNPWQINLDLDYAGKLLGENISITKSKEILTLLGMKIKGNGKIISVEVPVFRIDLKTQEDLIEEIGRIYGYEKIKAVPPLVAIQLPKIDEIKFFERKLKNFLVAEGFSEVYNYSFYGLKEAEMAGYLPTEHIYLENSLNVNQNMMRTSLLSLILGNVRENMKNFKEFFIFEIGRIYLKSKDVLPNEKNMLAGAMVFKKNDSEKKAVEFFNAKGYLDNFLKNVGIRDYYYVSAAESSEKKISNIWHQGRVAEIRIEGSQKSLGFFGEINPLLLTRLGINCRVIAFEFEVEKIFEVVENEMEYLPLRKFPVVTRDISLVVKKSVLVDELLQTIQKIGGELVLDVDLFDLFDFVDGSTSYAFHIMLGADDRTLESIEVERIISSINQGLINEYDVKIRQ